MKTKQRLIFALAIVAVVSADFAPADPLPSASSMPLKLPDANELSVEFDRDVPGKQAALEKLRQAFIAQPPRGSPDSGNVAKVTQFIGLLQDTGRFDDLPGSTRAEWSVALARLNAIAGRYKRLSDDDRAALRPKLIKSASLYSRDMIDHPDPFTGAAFTGPRNVVGIYFSLYNELQQPDAADAVAALKDAAFMCWYWPIVHGDDRRKMDPYRLETFLGDAHFTTGNTTYRPIVECAVIRNDTKMMDVVHAIITRSLANRTSYQTESESLWGQQGLLFDGNGFAHGRQSYLFGYVRDWFNGATTIGTQFRGTPWEIPATSWDLCAAMLLDGSQWYVYHSDIDWSVAGRHNMYPGPIEAADKNLLGMIGRLLDVSQGELKRKGELIALRDRIAAKNEFDGNRWFWNAEDMIQRRGSYYLSVNLSSIRSVSPENVSPNSHVNMYMASGAMMIKTRGDEYQQTRGAINYAALPGTTGMPDRPLPKDETWEGFPGDNLFCGGVSDGRIGVCGFELKQKLLPVTGHKGYFFFDDFCVALGAGLTQGQVATTLNQTRWATDACYGTGSAIEAISSSTNTTLPTAATQWFYNDGIGYVLPAGMSGKEIHLRAEQRMTRWAELAKINAGKPEAADVQVPVFWLSINHPQGAGNDRYCYAILPSVSAEQTAAAAKKLPFKVLANTPSLQIVKHEASGAIQAIFYDAGNADVDGFTLAVDRPAVLMLQPASGGYHVLVADPLQRDPAGSVTLTITIGGKASSIQITLPERPMIGSAAVGTLGISHP